MFGSFGLSCSVNGSLKLLYFLISNVKSCTSLPQFSFINVSKFKIKSLDSILKSLEFIAKKILLVGLIINLA